MTETFLERFAAEAEDVLTAILTHSRDCIKLLNLAGEIEFVSDSAAQALGLERPSDAIGSAWRHFWPESEWPALEAALDEARSGASARFSGATSVSGEERWWEVVVSPVRGEQGEITHLLAVSTDVTARIESARENDARRARAEREVGRAVTISGELRHRLKNQLAVVAAVAKLLARHTVDARDLATKLEEKLIALARAQDLLTADRETPIGAREAITEVIGASGAGERIDLADLPDVPLPDESVQQVALILGELQTNALKHGALRDQVGTVVVSAAAKGSVLTLRWEEDCGQPVEPVEAGNGGFQLIRRLGAAGGEQPRIAWEHCGIVVEFHVRTTA